MEKGINALLAINLRESQHKSNRLVASHKFISSFLWCASHVMPRQFVSIHVRKNLVHVKLVLDLLLQAWLIGLIICGVVSEISLILECDGS